MRGGLFVWLSLGLVFLLNACASDESQPTTSPQTYEARWQGITAWPCHGNFTDVGGRPLSDVLKTTSSVTLYPEQTKTLAASSPENVVLILSEPAMARYHPLLRQALNEQSIVPAKTYCVYDAAAVLHAAGLPEKTKTPMVLTLNDQGKVTDIQGNEKS